MTATQSDRIAIGPGSIYVGPYATGRDWSDHAKSLALLKGNATATPAVVAALTNVGWTDSGTEFEFELEIKDYFVDQRRAAVKRKITGIKGGLEVTMSEVSFRAFQLALGGGEIADHTTSKTYTPPAELGEWTAAWLSDDEKEILVIPKTGAGGALKMKRNKDDATTVPLSLPLLEGADPQPFYYHALNDAAVASLSAL